jgi:plastocyanin
MNTRRGFVAVALCAVAMLMAAPAHAGDGGGHGHDGDGGHQERMDDDHGGRRRGRHHETATTVPGARVIAVKATSYEFAPDEITLGAGEDVTIALRSTDILHDFVVKRHGHVVAAKAKQTKRGGLRIDEPGSYRFWCSIEGHRAAGMEGTIVVQ